MSRPDLLVVGAGPAGLAVAIAARREGLAVRVIDKAPGPPIDKACGEGLMPDGVAALERMGIAPASLAGAPFAGIRYVDGDVIAEGRFPGEPGLGVRRTRLHSALAARAAAVGVEVEWGTRVVGLEGGEEDGGRRGRAGGDRAWTLTTAEGERLEAAVVVGADGLRSRVRRWAGLDGNGDTSASSAGDANDADHESPSLSAADADAVVSSAGDVRSPTRLAVGPTDSSDLPDSRPTGAPGSPPSPAPAPANDPTARFGVRRHYRVPPGELPHVVEVWWGDGCEAYVTPVGPEEVGVAMLWSGRKAGFDALLRGFPGLARRFVGRPVISDDRGAGPLLQRVGGVVRRGARGGDGAGGGLALVGDASGYVDAITGEGLSLAFAQAEALVAAVVAGDLDAYAAAHRRIGRVPNALTRLLLAVERRPPLRRRAIRALAAEPALFSRLLAIHARQLPAAAFFPAGAARLAWRLARSPAG